jgi:hypothetical protein
MTFPNDYQGVHRALTLGKWVEPATDLGRQFGLLAQHMVEARPRAPQAAGKKRFLEYFSVVPGRFAIPETKKPAV